MSNNIFFIENIPENIFGLLKTKFQLKILILLNIMKILIDMINNPQAIVNKDHRYIIFKQIMVLWKEKGHIIYIDKVKNVKIEPIVLKTYNVYSDKVKDQIDLYICFGIYKEGVQRHKYYSERNVKCITYDHSWLPNSVLFERQKLFSDSYFHSILEEEINKDYNETEANKYITQLLKDNSSKRPQARKDNVPEEIKLKYVFIPFQKSNDISLLHYSKYGMFEFTSKIVDLCKDKNIPVVMKIHPHVNGKEKGLARQCYQKMQKKYNNCFLLDTSIYDLVRNARFTVCLNSGTLIDNFVTQTPVLSCARSMFDSVECMVYEENIEKGFERMINKDYRTAIIRENQKKIVYWLKNKLLYSHLGPIENKKRFDYLAGIEM